MRSTRGVLESTSYQRRTPTATVLHAVVRDQLESFLEDARARSAHGCGVPRHVDRELRNYLACGVLAHGFVRVRCADCGVDRLVAFSCKGRAVCPSFRGRRVAAAAAHLVDPMGSRPVRRAVRTSDVGIEIGTYVDDEPGFAAAAG